MGNNFLKIWAFIIVVGVVYLFFSFINYNLNPAHWGTVSRCVFGFFAMIGFFKTLVD